MRRALVAPPAAGPRLLPPDARTGRFRDADAHLDHYGPVPSRTPGEIVAEVRAAGLRGRGGAGFPVARKLEAVTGRSAVVVANAAEGEPASRKDAVLLDLMPQLVLDGIQVAARAVGARQAYLAVGPGGNRARLGRLADERRRGGVDEVPVTVAPLPGGFLDGEETALVSWLSGGPGVPRGRTPAVWQRGVGGRPTLVQNVETLAALALVARFGAEWWRSIGTPAEPGSALVTLTGAGRPVAVEEVAYGTPFRMLLDRGREPDATVLLGGFHGTWVSADDLRRRRFCDEDLAPLGARIGAGIVVALPASVCGVVETAWALRYLADQSAGQCGPCRNGLPALAAVAADAARGRRDPALPERISLLADLVDGRGACRHPDGTARLARSMRHVFARELLVHQDGRCSATDTRPVLTVPGRG